MNVKGSESPFRIYVPRFPLYILQIDIDRQIDRSTTTTTTTTTTMNTTTTTMNTTTTTIPPPPRRPPPHHHTHTLLPHLCSSTTRPFPSSTFSYASSRRPASPPPPKQLSSSCPWEKRGRIFSRPLPWISWITSLRVKTKAKSNVDEVSTRTTIFIRLQQRIRITFYSNLLYLPSRECSRVTLNRCVIIGGEG